jgi:hypothetical protein
MTVNLFGVKTAQCRPSEVFEKAVQLEAEWLDSLLLRLNIPKIMLDKRKSGQFSNPQWRDYLFDTFGLNIYKHLSEGKIQIFKWNDQREENTLVAEWTKPEVIEKTSNAKKFCELHLKYWQIV